MPRRALPNRQQYTITAGGRRIRLARGNVFPTKTEAKRAANDLRVMDGATGLRVRALKEREGVLVNAKPMSCEWGQCGRRATRMLPGPGKIHVCARCYQDALREDRRSSLRNSHDQRPRPYAVVSVTKSGALSKSTHPRDSRFVTIDEAQDALRRIERLNPGKTFVLGECNERGTVLGEVRVSASNSSKCGCTGISR